MLAIGDGSENVHTDVGEDIIQIPEQYLVKTIEALIKKVFPLVGTCYPDKYFVSRCAILTPRNDDVDMINEWIIEKFPGAAATYRSADTVAEDDLRNAYPTEFLNSITLSGMPPLSMTLKVGAPVMLLRNLRAGPGNGLRNGTWLIVLKVGVKVFEAEIATGVNKGKCVVIPRITFSPLDTDLPFTLRRQQFPVRPCFAMTTNKARDRLWNLLVYICQIMSSPMVNCMLL